MGRTPIIAGNWKLNKLTAEAVAIVEDIKAKLAKVDSASMPEVVICPVFTALQSVSNTLEHGQNIRLGAQNCYHKDSGAFTGEVSLPMLKDLCVTDVIIGHSERREYFSESDEMVNLKVKAALANEVTPIICVGESLEQREQGITDDHIASQVKKALDGLSAAEVGKVVFAYEPIWAIGTGKTCDSVEANRVIKMIRSVIASVSNSGIAASVRILYGGSVKPSTIEEQMAQSDIDGALVGGASLDAESFVGIITGSMKSKV